jgi:penicillin G amidase
LNFLAVDGLAPFFILPGDGTAEWEGRMDARYIPHAKDPASGLIVTANSDPVGATFDGDPFNQPVIDGRPLYLSATYATGFRTERITRLLEQGGQGGGALTLADMARVQHDAASTVGSHLTPPIVAALARLDDPGTSPADVAPYLAGLPAADLQRLATARTLLTGWSFATPPAMGAPDPDSAATAVFNAWMHFFLADVIGDELDAAGFERWRLREDLLVRVAHSILVLPDTMVQSPTTGQPIVCDRIEVAGPDDSCTTMILRALVAAMTHLESAAGFGTADTAAWRWGKLHRLKLEPLFPNTALELPPPTDPDAPGFPRAGDNFVINRADQGWKDLDFSQHADGPAQRFLAIAEPGRPIAVKWQLPTGVIFDSRSSHYRDLLDNHYLPEIHFDAPYLVPEIVAAGETRWVFR